MNELTKIIYFVELDDGGKSASCESMEESLEFIANNFGIEAEDIGTWADSDGQTLVWATQDEADAARDNSDVIAVITLQYPTSHL